MLFQQQIVIHNNNNNNIKRQAAVTSILFILIFGNVTFATNITTNLNNNQDKSGTVKKDLKLINETIPLPQPPPILPAAPAPAIIESVPTVKTASAVAASEAEIIKNNSSINDNYKSTHSITSISSSTAVSIMVANETKNNHNSGFNSSAVIDNNNNININNNNTSHLNNNIVKANMRNLQNLEIPDSYRSGFYIFIGLGVLAVLFLIFRSYRLRLSRAERRYGVQGDRRAQELTPLPISIEDDSETEDHTVFDIHSKQLRIS